VLVELGQVAHLLREQGLQIKTLIEDRERPIDEAEGDLETSRLQDLEAEINTLRNQKKCLKSAAKTVSSTLSVLRGSDGENSSAAHESEFNDVFEDEPDRLTLNWVEHHRVQQFGNPGTMTITQSLQNFNLQSVASANQTIYLDVDDNDLDLELAMDLYELAVSPSSTTTAVEAKDYLLQCLKTIADKEAAFAESIKLLSMKKSVLTRLYIIELENTSIDWDAVDTHLDQSLLAIRKLARIFETRQQTTELSMHIQEQKEVMALMIQNYRSRQEWAKAIQLSKERIQLISNKTSSAQEESSLMSGKLDLGEILYLSGNNTEALGHARSSYDFFRAVTSNEKENCRKSLRLLIDIYKATHNLPLANAYASRLQKLEQNAAPTSGTTSNIAAQNPIVQQSTPQSAPSNEQLSSSSVDTSRLVDDDDDTRAVLGVATANTSSHNPVPISTAPYRVQVSKPLYRPHEPPEMTDTYLDRIIDKLLEPRRSRPLQMVQLLGEEIRYLCTKAREVFMNQPVLLEIEAPIKVFSSNTIGGFTNKMFGLLATFMASIMTFLGCLNMEDFLLKQTICS
jgi:hypothetical protein